jgi:hypothetical protein
MHGCLSYSGNENDGFFWSEKADLRKQTGSMNRDAIGWNKRPAANR